MAELLRSLAYSAAVGGAGVGLLFGIALVAFIVAIEGSRRE